MVLCWSVYWEHCLVDSTAHQLWLMIRGGTWRIAVGCVCLNRPRLRFNMVLVCAWSVSIVHVVYGYSVLVAL